MIQLAPQAACRAYKLITHSGRQLSSTMNHKIKLTYFKTPGRAQPIRHAFALGDIPFEDDYVPFDEFAALQQSGTLPFRSLPLLTVDGKTFAESAAMLRFAGKLAGIYPKDPFAAMKVDMVVDALNPILSALQADKSEEARKKVLSDTFPRFFGAINKMYAGTNGPYLLGETISIADLKVAAFAGGMNKGGSGNLEHIPAGSIEQFAHLMACTKAVLREEKIKAWNEAHPELKD